ncbi:hypothetical protein [Sphingopyxis flava]|uniref:Uncharacterized protein n=1 Tax=Sphingopyxis flava TaxID=1507287 RepID=A0A1T5BQN2_9SPHN|nr:hypothetical protein [Sphingopyxis flava]SKB49672.1 hypothetical protein SAMN06295937_100767 [Sphingopyxis flava]
MSKKPSQTAPAEAPEAPTEAASEVAPEVAPEASPEAPAEDTQEDAAEAPEAAPESTGRVVEDHTEEPFPESESSPYDRKPKVERTERNGRVIETYL